MKLLQFQENRKDDNLAKPLRSEIHEFLRGEQRIMNPQSNPLPEHESHLSFHHPRQLPSLYDTRNKTVSNKNPLKSCSKKYEFPPEQKTSGWVHTHSIDIHAHENNTKNEIYIQFIELNPFSI